MSRSLGHATLLLEAPAGVVAQALITHVVLMKAHMVNCIHNAVLDMLHCEVPSPGRRFLVRY